jgi:CheY-like chemotaxis protein
VQQALSAGARKVLTKPVLEEQLAQVITELRQEKMGSDSHGASGEQ